MIRSTWYHKGKRALSLHCASGLFFRVSPHIRLRVCGVLQREALRLQLSMQRGLARRGRPERAMRTGDANVSNMVGAVGLEPTSPRAEDFKSPASANSATLPSRPTAAVYSTKSRHRLFPRWAQRGLFHGGSIFSPHQLGRRTGESTPAISAAGVSAAAGRNARSVGKDAYHRSPRARAESAPCRMSVSLAV